MWQPNALVHSLASIISAFYLLQKLKKSSPFSNFLLSNYRNTLMKINPKCNVLTVASNTFFVKVIRNQLSRITVLNTEVIKFFNYLV